MWDLQYIGEIIKLLPNNLKQLTLNLSQNNFIGIE